jgi:hypothetical protein
VLKGRLLHSLTRAHKNDQVGALEIPHHQHSMYFYAFQSLPTGAPPRPGRAQGGPRVQEGRHCAEAVQGCACVAAGGTCGRGGIESGHGKSIQYYLLKTSYLWSFSGEPGDLGTIGRKGEVVVALWLWQGEKGLVARRDEFLPQRPLVPTAFIEGYVPAHSKLFCPQRPEHINHKSSSQSPRTW